MIKCVGENKAFECENCASAFSKVDALKAHTDARKDLNCTLCDFVATKPSKLTRHMITHNPKPAKVEEKSPKCDMTFENRICASGNV